MLEVISNFAIAVLLLAGFFVYFTVIIAAGIYVGLHVFFEKHSITITIAEKDTCKRVVDLNRN